MVSFIAVSQHGCHSNIFGVRLRKGQGCCQGQTLNHLIFTSIWLRVFGLALWENSLQAPLKLITIVAMATYLAYFDFVVGTVIIIIFFCVRTKKLLVTTTKFIGSQQELFRYRHKIA